MSSPGGSSVPLDAAACPDPRGKQLLLKAQQQSKLSGIEVYDLLTNRVVRPAAFGGTTAPAPWRAHELLLFEAPAQAGADCPAWARTGGADMLSGCAGGSVYLYYVGSEAGGVLSYRDDGYKWPRTKDEGSSKLKVRCAAVACAWLGPPSSKPLTPARTGRPRGQSAVLYRARGAGQRCRGARFPTTGSRL